MDNNVLPSNDPDDLSYFRFAGPQRRDKAYNTLIGLLDGIRSDGVVSKGEFNELRDWVKTHEQLDRDLVFRDVLNLLRRSLADGVLDLEEISDIRFACENASSNSPYFNDVTQSIIQLQGILHGLISDRVISDAEAKYLSDWVEANSHLQKHYPITEIESILLTVLADGKIDPDEQNLLVQFFEQFAQLSPNYTAERIKENRPPVDLRGICAMAPTIEFEDRRFCFTGVPYKGTRAELSEIVLSKGGAVAMSVSSQLNYLVICDSGNPCWAFSTYGRKVEKAMTLRREGHSILLVRERDFWDSLVE